MTITFFHELDDQLEDYMYHFCRFFVSSFEIFCFDSLAVRRFPFLGTVNWNTQFFHGEFWDVFVLFMVFNIFHHRQHGHQCFQVCFRCPPRHFFHRSYSRTDLLKKKYLKCVSNTCPRRFDVSSFVSHMRAKVFLHYCLDIRDRFHSFELFKNVLYLPMSFGSFVVSDSFF